MNNRALKLEAKDLPAYTYVDYLQWEGEWELVQGIPYAMAPSPVKSHQILALAIGSELLSQLGQCPNCEVLLDEDWKVDAHTILKPDVAMVCDDSNPNYIAKTPEVIFEIASPATVRRDEGLKFDIYQAEGVKYYVLVYPDDRLAKVYQHNGEIFQLAAKCNTDTFAFIKVKCPFKLDFSTIFKWLRTTKSK